MLNLDDDGVAVVAGVLDEARCAALCAQAAQAVAAPDAPGTRSLLVHDWCRALAAALRPHPGIAPHVASSHVDAAHVGVQCTYFEKSVDRNWLVPVHQDLSIPVARRVDHPDLRGWSHKEGSLFVQPPVSVLERLLAVRVHLDPCQADDGALQFVPGTQRRGRIDAEGASALKRAGPVVTPLLACGDVLLMRPLVLHASAKATGTSRRRVLHFLFGPASLPYGLNWEFPALL